MSSGGVEKGRVVLMWTRRVECAGASTRQTTGSSRVGGWKFLFLTVTKKYMKHPPVTFPGALGRPAHGSAAHQRTFVRDYPAHKARPLMGETAGISLNSLNSLRLLGLRVQTTEAREKSACGAANFVYRTAARRVAEYLPELNPTHLR